MSPALPKARWLSHVLTLGFCLGVGTAALGWSYHRGVAGHVDRQMRGRALASEDGALNIIARASARGHTAARKRAALARVRARGCPQPHAYHALWVLDDQGETLLLCGGKRIAPASGDPADSAPRGDPAGLLSATEAKKLLARIRAEGVARHPPIPPRAIDVDHDPPLQLTGRQFEPWRWIVGSSLDLERTRALARGRQQQAAVVGWAGAGLALLCLAGLLRITRRRG